VLKKFVRGIRPLEQGLAARDDPEAEVSRGYCLAVRSALSDTGHPPLHLPGLALHERLSAIAASLERVGEKRGCPTTLPRSSVCSGRDSLPVLSTGSVCRRRRAGWCEQHRSWRTTRRQTRQQWKRSIGSC
jgi:hypothetical protein